MRTNFFVLLISIVILTQVSFVRTEEAKAEGKAEKPPAKEASAEKPAGIFYIIYKFLIL